MSGEIALQVIQTAAVVIGVGFGLIQLKQLRDQREVQAGIELLHPLQAPESAEALLLLHGLPDNLSGEELRKRLERFKGWTDSRDYVNRGPAGIERMTCLQMRRRG